MADYGEGPICDTILYCWCGVVLKWWRGAPAKGVGRLYRRESSNLSCSASKNLNRTLCVWFRFFLFVLPCGVRLFGALECRSAFVSGWYIVRTALFLYRQKRRFMPRKTLDTSRSVVGCFAKGKRQAPSGLGGWLLCLTPTLRGGSCQEYRGINSR